jgi:hypothetical protein
MEVPNFWDEIKKEMSQFKLLSVSDFMDFERTALHYEYIVTSILHDLSEL